MTDSDLVNQALKGRVSAYGTLVRRWSARITAYLRGKVRNADVAEDLAQEALLRAYQALPTLSDPKKFGSWLLGIAHHLALDWLKAKARTEVSLGDMEPGRVGQSHVRDHMKGQAISQCQRLEEHEIMLREIESLPAPLYEVLVMYYYDDVTYQQVAETLGISTATVNARLTKARAILRSKLNSLRESS